MNKDFAFDTLCDLLREYETSYVSRADRFQYCALLGNDYYLTFTGLL